MARVAAWSGNGLADGTVVDDASRGWGDTAWGVVSTNGTPFTISASGLFSQRVRMAQAAGEAAQMTWDTSIIGTLGAHTIRAFVEFSGYPGSNGRLISVYNSGLTLQYYVDMTPAGLVRLKDGAGNTLDQTTAAFPLNEVHRIEVVGNGTGTITVTLYSGLDTTAWDTLTSTGLGTSVQEIRFGNPNAAPTWPTMYWGGIYVTNTAAVIGPYPAITQTFTASGTFNPPAGVSRAYVECWGGGGSGGASGVTAGWGGGGGGGGEYAADTNLEVTPSGAHTVTVGAGSTSSAAGGTSTFAGTSFSVVANGGSSTTTQTGAAGGTGSANPIHFNGGAGAGGNSSGNGGGGGSSAGPLAAGGGGGGAASAPTNGGTAPAQGGNGGGGGTPTVNGTTGSQPGGGGGGKGNTKAAGNGATGKVIVTYLDPTPTTSSIAFRDVKLVPKAATLTDTTVIRRPVSVQAGDTMVVGFVTTQPSGLAAPAGWTQLGTTLVEGNASAALFTKDATSTEPPYYTWQNGGVAASLAVIGVWSGSDSISDYGLASTLTDATVFDSPTVTVPASGWLVTLPWERRNAAAVVNSWTDSDGSDVERVDGGSASGTGSDFSAALYDSNRPLAAGDYHRTLTASQMWAQVGIWSLALSPTSTTTDESVRLAGGGAVEVADASVITPGGSVDLPGVGGLTVDASLVTVPAGPVSMGGAGALVIDASLVTIPAGPVDLSGTGGMTITDATVLIITEVTMGGVGGLDVSVRYPETLLVNGINIYDCIQYMTPDVDGLISPPGKKTGNVDVPGRHGAVRTPHKRYGVSVMPLTIWVKGVNPDGSIPSNRREAFYDNLNTILRAFTGDVVLEHITPNGDARVIEAEVLDSIDFTRYVWGATGRVGLNLTAAYPFWQDKTAATEDIFTEGPHTLDSFAPSTAPIDYMTITFAGPSTNPRVACGDYFVQYSGVLGQDDQITIDTENWTLTSPSFTPDYAALVHAGIGQWFTLTPAEGGPVVTYSQTGTGPGSVSITAKNAYLGG